MESFAKYVDCPGCEQMMRAGSCHGQDNNYLAHEDADSPVESDSSSDFSSASFSESSCCQSQSVPASMHGVAVLTVVNSEDCAKKNGHFPNIEFVFFVSAIESAKMAVPTIGSSIISLAQDRNWQAFFSILRI